jgi:hypothetical protein
MMLARLSLRLGGEERREPFGVRWGMLGVGAADTGTDETFPESLESVARLSRMVPMGVVTVRCLSGREGNASGTRPENWGHSDDLPDSSAARPMKELLGGVWESGARSRAAEDAESWAM